jgi:Type VII secretion system ESX-1, transport TM domain B
MPLNLTSRLQVAAHHFWNRRNAATLSHHGVRLEYDPEQRRSAALILGFTFTILAVALMFILSWFKPAGTAAALTYWYSTMRDDQPTTAPACTPASAPPWPD